MIEAVWYGVAAALSFIGFVSVMCLAVLHFFNPKKKAAYIIISPSKAERQDIPDIIYSAYLRNMIFGNLLCDGVKVVDCGLDEEYRQLVIETVSQYSGVSFCTADELIDCITGKEKDGNGAC